MTTLHRLSPLAILLLAGCASTPNVPTTTTPAATAAPAVASSTSTAPAQIVYAAAASLSQAEVLAKTYTQSSVADPAIVAEIKTLDNAAYNAIEPILNSAAAGKSVISAVEASAATAALNALTSYLATNGISAAPSN